MLLYLYGFFCANISIVNWICKEILRIRGRPKTKYSTHIQYSDSFCHRYIDIKCARWQTFEIANCKIRQFISFEFIMMMIEKLKKQKINSKNWNKQISVEWMNVPNSSSIVTVWINTACGYKCANKWKLITDSKGK